MTATRASQRTIFASVFLFVAMGTLTALDLDDLLFYAPFDGSIDALYSHGNSTATTLTERGFAFKDGIRGQAIVFGGRGDNATEKPVLAYESAGNILPATGTLVFWSQAIDWLDFGLDGRYTTWMTLGIKEPSPGNWSIYRDGGGGNTGLWLEMGGKLFWTPSYLPTWEWPKGGNLWRHLAFTWQPGEVRFYLNGNLQGRYSEDVPKVERFFEELRLGRDDRWKVAIDELYIFKRALTSHEVGALYRLGKEAVGVGKITVPHLAEAPSIDGKLAAGEWESACSLTGFIDGSLGVQADESTQVLAGFDEHNLYAAISYAIPERVRRSRQLFPEGALRRRTTQRDGDLSGDDHYEITVCLLYTSPSPRD